MRNGRPVAESRIVDGVSRGRRLRRSSRRSGDVVQSWPAPRHPGAEVRSLRGLPGSSPQVPSNAPPPARCVCGRRSDTGKTSSPAGAASSEGAALCMYVSIYVASLSRCDSTAADALRQVRSTRKREDSLSLAHSLSPSSSTSASLVAASV